MKTNRLKITLLSVTACLFLAIGVGKFFFNGGFSTEHTRAEFEHVVESTNKDTMGSLYYRGRRDGYDYFKARWNFGYKNMRVEISESPITEPFNYSREREDWRGASFMALSGQDLKKALESEFKAKQS